MKQKHCSATCLASAVLLVGIVGCGGARPPDTQLSKATTTVTLLSTSTANDQVQNFFLELRGAALTDVNANTVPLLTSPSALEFIHVNGTEEPVMTFTVPQGVYSSASVSVGSAQFTCDTLVPSTGNVGSGEFGVEQVPASDVSVQLPSPITISGNSMQLVLNLQVQESAHWSQCVSSGLLPYSITPTFTLSSSPDAAEVNSSGPVQNVSLAGVVTTNSGTHLEITSPSIPVWEAVDPGPKWTVAVGNGTSIEGASGLSQVAVGAAAEVEATLQDDGGLTASRIAILDSDPANLSLTIGPVLSIWSSDPVMLVSGDYAQGYLPGSIGAAPFNFENATFQVMWASASDENLPFSADFSGSSIVAGQRVAITTHALSAGSAPTYIPASTVTLVPQTVNGSVTAISIEGGTTVFSIALADYDLFPELNGQANKRVQLQSPGMIDVYTSANTQLRLSRAVSVGTLVRVRGLVFDDGGILKMACSQIRDGVSE